jgi:hypothetical protein
MRRRPAWAEEGQQDPIAEVGVTEHHALDQLVLHAAEGDGRDEVERRSL